MAGPDSVRRVGEQSFQQTQYGSDREPPHRRRIACRGSSAIGQWMASGGGC